MRAASEKRRQSLKRMSRSVAQIGFELFVGVELFGRHMIAFDDCPGALEGSFHDLEIEGIEIVSQFRLHKSSSRIWPSPAITQAR